MLVLSRIPTEKIIIGLPSGDTITIEILEVKGEKVRIGLTAPRDIVIHREEIWNQIHGGQGTSN